MSGGQASSRTILKRPADHAARAARCPPAVGARVSAPSLMHRLFGRHGGRPLQALFALVCWLLMLPLPAPVAAQPESGFPLDLQVQAEIDAADRERLGAPEGEPLTGAALAERTHVVAALMRCPSCQGLSVADSPTAASAAMRAKIERLLAEGYSEDQVLAYFEASYGEFIRLAPRARGFNLVVWIAPVATLLAGFALIAWRVRGARHAEQESEELERYRRRVRAESQ